MILSVTTGTPWIVTPAPNPMARLRLFCLPYAGSGASAYSTWPRALPSDIELCAIQLPGREARLREPSLTRWDDVSELVAEAMRPWTDKPFAFFGHSLGAFLAFELARRLRRDRSLGFTHLFVSGCRAPHLPLDEPPIHDVPTSELVEELRRSRGTPPEVLDCPDLLEHFIPALRADFRLYETYVYHADAPLAAPVSVYGGMEDEQAAAAKLQEWRQHTTSAFRQVMFCGGHFFLKEHRAAVLSHLAGELREIIATAV